MAFALDQRLAVALLDNLNAAGGDLSALTVRERTWADSSTSGILGPVSSIRGHVALAAIQQELQRHRSTLVRVLTGLLPFHDQFLLCFGQGLAARFDCYAARWSHDLDLLVPSLEVGHEIAASLVAEQGFTLSDQRTVDVPRGIGDWRLDRTDQDGRLVHVDLCSAAISSSTSWLPPMPLKHLFERSVATTQGAATVQVPCDTHQLLLTSQKAQRNLVFDQRARNDAALLMSHGDLDLAEIVTIADHYGLQGSISWLTGYRLPNSGAELVMISALTGMHPKSIRKVAGRLYPAIWRRSNPRPL